MKKALEKGHTKRLAQTSLRDAIGEKRPQAAIAARSNERSHPYPESKRIKKQPKRSLPGRERLGAPRKKPEKEKDWPEAQAARVRKKDPENRAKERK